MKNTCSSFQNITFHLHDSVFNHGLGAILGTDQKPQNSAQNCPMSTLDCIIMQMRQIIGEKSYWSNLWDCGALLAAFHAGNVCVCDYALE